MRSNMLTTTTVYGYPINIQSTLVYRIELYRETTNAIEKNTTNGRCITNGFSFHITYECYLTDNKYGCTRLTKYDRAQRM